MLKEITRHVCVRVRVSVCLCGCLCSRVRFFNVFVVLELVFMHIDVGMRIQAVAVVFTRVRSFSVTSYMFIFSNLTTNNYSRTQSCW